MLNREKVIRGLECLADVHNENCVGCGYIGIGIYPICVREVAKDALSLLKEQESVKPYIDIDEAKCPICKVKLTRQELLGDDVLFEDFYDYCPHCGRKVKWE